MKGKEGVGVIGVTETSFVRVPIAFAMHCNCLNRRIFFPPNRLRNTALHEATLLGLAGRECIAALLRYVPGLGGRPLRTTVIPLLTVMIAEGPSS